MFRSALIVILCLTACATAAKPKLPKIWGSVKIDDHTLMCETEVTIGEWMNFIANNSFEESLFPDTACLSVSTKIIFNDLRKRSHFKYLKLRGNTGREKLKGQLGVTTSAGFKTLAEADTDYLALNLPVTGISYDQALLFCRWKEAVLLSSGYPQVGVSLPSPEVYKRVIPNIDTLSKNCQCFVLNSSTAKNNKPFTDKRVHTQGHAAEPVESYFPTELGLYNIQGNAAEMTSVNGVAMGGSFRQTARQSYNDRQQSYTQPEGWLGFRYIITIKQ